MDFNNQSNSAELTTLKIDENSFIVTYNSIPYIFTLTLQLSTINITVNRLLNCTYVASFLMQNLSKSSKVSDFFEDLKGAYSLIRSHIESNSFKIEERYELLILKFTFDFNSTKNEVKLELPMNQEKYNYQSNNQICDLIINLTQRVKNNEEAIRDLNERLTKKENLNSNQPLKKGLSESYVGELEDLF